MPTISYTVFNCVGGISQCKTNPLGKKNRHFLLFVDKNHWKYGEPKRTNGKNKYKLGKIIALTSWTVNILMHKKLLKIRRKNKQPHMKIGKRYEQKVHRKWIANSSSLIKRLSTSLIIEQCKLNLHSNTISQLSDWQKSPNLSAVLWWVKGHSPGRGGDLAMSNKIIHPFPFIQQSHF